MTWPTWITRTIARLRAPATGAGLTPLRGPRTGRIITVREPYTGAWQKNDELTTDSVVQNPTVFACVTLIATDAAKLRLRLVEQTGPGVWAETTNPAYTPVLRRPNRYQTPLQFFSSWFQSKLLHGNTYVLLGRDARGVVAGMFVLDPTRVTPLVAPDGAVYYELRRDDLAGVQDDVAAATPLIVPASEIIHDRINTLFHPLVGVSPIFAAGVAALQGLKTLEYSTQFFANGARPGGIILVPGAVDDDSLTRIKTKWETNYGGPNLGRLALLADGMKYEPVAMSAVDAQLIDQLKWTAETIATVYHIPPYLVVPGAPTPPYTTPESLFAQYYSQCLQAHLTGTEQCLDDGLSLPTNLGTEFDVDDLVWMDTATKTKAAADGINAGALSPNEARRKYFGLGPVDGGDTPYLQQQYWPLNLLGARTEVPGAAVSTPTRKDLELSPADEAALVAQLAADCAAGLIPYES